MPPSAFSLPNGSRPPISLNIFMASLAISLLRERSCLSPAGPAFGKASSMALRNS